MAASSATIHEISETSKDVMLTMRTLGKKMSQVATISEATQLYQQLQGISVIMQRFGIRLEASLIKPLPAKESDLSEWAVLSSFAISIMRQRVHTAVKWLESNRAIPARVEAIRHFVSAVALFLDTGKVELPESDDTVSFILGELQRDNSSSALVKRTASASSASQPAPAAATATPTKPPKTPTPSAGSTPTTPSAPTTTPSVASKAATNKTRTMSTSAATPKESTVSPRVTTAAASPAPTVAAAAPAATATPTTSTTTTPTSTSVTRGRGARGRGTARSETRKSGTALPVTVEGLATAVRKVPSPAAVAASPAHLSHPALPVAAPSPRRDVNELRSRFEQKLSSPSLKTAVVVVTTKKQQPQPQQQQQQQPQPQPPKQSASPRIVKQPKPTTATAVTPSPSKEAPSESVTPAAQAHAADDRPRTPSPRNHTADEASVSPASAPSPTPDSYGDVHESSSETEGAELEGEPEPQTEPEPDFGIAIEPPMGQEAELESSASDLGAMSEPEASLSPRRNNKRIKSRRVQSAKINKMAVHKQAEHGDESDSVDGSGSEGSPAIKRTSSFPTAPLESSDSASTIAAPTSLSVPDVSIPLRPPTKSRSKSVSAPESAAAADGSAEGEVVEEDTERKVIASAMAATSNSSVSKSSDQLAPRSKKKSHLDAAKGTRKRPQSFSQKILRRKEATAPAVATNASPAPAPSSAAYLKGTLRLYQAGALRGAWKARHCVLTEEKLEFYKDEQATSLVRELPLGNITSMQKDKGKAKDKKEIGIVANIVTGDSKISIGFTDETQSSQWLLAIDGQRARVYGSCMEAIERHVLLNQLFKEGFKGGNIKGPDEEEWLYRANGILKNTESLNPAIKGQSYLWDGETLRAKYKNSFGFGVWNGVTMQWYRSEEAYTNQGDEHNPVVVYYWDPLTREYHTASRDPKQTWKWTRHFLARKEGGGEWIMEGNVPEPVIMFLQLLRQTFEMGDDVVLHEPSTPSGEPRDEPVADLLDGSGEH